MKGDFSVTFEEGTTYANGRTAFASFEDSESNKDNEATNP